ncbi:hypothetical protein V8G54_010367 [Vigna mungo]|uniref:Transmembrane protein n=1 Tax=Vigna mungo TaxID=3915 RepID=A0AAQ3NWE3_VIGMU
MSKKNNLAKRKKQYEFDLQSTVIFDFSSIQSRFQYSCSDFRVCVDFHSGEKQEKQKKEKKLLAKKNSMKVSVCLSILSFFFAGIFIYLLLKKVGDFWFWVSCFSFGL